ncbi:MAG: pirin family protein [Actinomycetota bacterium]
MSDRVELLIEPRVRPVGAGEVRRLLPFRRRRMVGPFVFADVMGPDEFTPRPGSGVDAHPHIGLSTVTYLLTGRSVHRDSTGAVQTIEPGAVNWMTAGAGVTHTERPHPDDIGTLSATFGLQTWVALPDGAENVDAAFEHCAASDVPTDDGAGARVRLAVGTGFGLTAPISGSSPLVLAEIELDDGSIRIPPEHVERAVICMAGHVRVDGTSLAPAHLAVLAPGAQPELTGSGTVMLLGGDPVGPRTIWWNFVHSDP